MSVKTSYQDLARLGHTRREIFLICNARRGGTMTNESHMHLNNEFVDQYGWWSYNTILGDAVLMGSVPQNIEDTVVSVEYDNTFNNQSISEEWTEQVVVGTRSTLGFRNSSLIELSQTITIGNVASSGFSMQIGTETTSEQVVDRTTTTTRNFTIHVGPHESVRILRTRTEIGSIATYHVPYGLNSTAMIGTQGRRWNGHYHWGFRLNGILGNPRANMVLNGTSNNTSYLFRVVRVLPEGAKSSGVSKVFAHDPSTGESLELPIEDEVAPLKDAVAPLKDEVASLQVTNAAEAIGCPGI
ncbi:hypothetical protein JB92DRAFT_1579162 [Gautieria morchelliformis]|nr:hypothetical protein JB92DRAFT_1579162 [Gautieria morchelliformis]